MAREKPRKEPNTKLPWLGEVEERLRKRGLSPSERDQEKGRAAAAIEDSEVADGRDESKEETGPARTRTGKQQSAELPQAARLQLDLWPDDNRAAPNEMLRCALFSVRSKTARRLQFYDEPLLTLGPGDLRYTGPELRQREADVYFELLHLGRKIPLGDAVPFRPRDLLKLLGWPLQNSYYTLLYDTINHLAAGTTMVVADRLLVEDMNATVDDSYLGKEPDTQVSGTNIALRGDGKKRNFVTLHLITKFEGDRPEPGQRVGDSTWRVWLDPEYARLFAGDHFARFRSEMRKKLSRDTAKWLLNYFSTHKQPKPVKVETLRIHTGSNAKRLDTFRATLTESLDELVQVGFLRRWDIAGVGKQALVHVERIPLREQMDPESEVEEASGKGRGGQAEFDLASE